MAILLLGRSILAMDHELRFLIPADHPAHIDCFPLGIEVP